MRDLILGILALATIALYCIRFVYTTYLLRITSEPHKFKTWKVFVPFTDEWVYSWIPLIMFTKVHNVHSKKIRNTVNVATGLFYITIITLFIYVSLI